jgi:hypothetical protein
MTVYAMEHIMDSMEEGDPAPMTAAFPEVPADGLVWARGEVSLLIGQDNLGLFPAERRRMGNVALHHSRFVIGWVASGRPPQPGACEKTRQTWECTIAKTPEAQLDAETEDAPACSRGKSNLRSLPG